MLAVKNFHGDSKLQLISTARDLILSSDVLGHLYVCVVHMHMCMSNAHSQNINESEKEKKILMLVVRLDSTSMWLNGCTCSIIK